MTNLTHEVIDDRGHHPDGNQPIMDTRTELVSILGEQRLQFFINRFAEAVNIPVNEFYRRARLETVE